MDTLTKHGMNRSSIKKKPNRARTGGGKSFDLEFSECWLDPPRYRQAIAQYEETIEGTRDAIKKTTKHIQDLITKGQAFAEAQKTLNADLVNGFQIGTIGPQLSQDELFMKNSLGDFSEMFTTYMVNFEIMLESMSKWKGKIDRFRENRIEKAYTEKRRAYKKYRDKYYKNMASNSGVGEGHKESKQNQAIRDTKKSRKEYHENALAYVDTLLAIEEEKKYELVENLSSIAGDWLQFTKSCYECHHLENSEKIKQTLNLSNNQRARHKSIQENLDKHRQNHVRNPSTRLNENEDAYEGHVLQLEKGFSKGPMALKTAGYKWSHRYLEFSAKKKQIVLYNPDSVMSRTTYSVVFDSSRMDDMNTDRKNIFHIQVSDNKQGDSKCLTFQAASEEEFKRWQQLVSCNTGGNPRVYVDPGSGGISCASHNIELDDHIVGRLQECITHVESGGGLEMEGAYRTVAVQSKVDNLLKKIIDPSNSVDLNNCEVRTIMSAIKALFRNLREPILTFENHETIIDIFRNNDVEIDVKSEEFKGILQTLPEVNKVVLKMICEHLVKVAANDSVNKMSAQNISVCFGPAFMWAKQETIAGLQDVKYQCTVVELLIEKHDSFFQTSEEIKTMNQTLQKHSFSLSNRTTSRISLFVHFDKSELPPVQSSLPSDSRRESQNRRSEYDNLHYHLTPQKIAEFSESSKIPDIDESETTDDNRSPAIPRAFVSKKNSSSSTATNSSSEDFDNSLTIDGSNEELNSSADGGKVTLTRQRLQKSSSEMEDIREKHKTDTDFNILVTPGAMPDNIQKSPITSIRSKSLNKGSSRIQRRPTGNESDHVRPSILRKQSSKDAGSIFGEPDPLHTELHSPQPSASPAVMHKSSSAFELATRAKAKYACKADNPDELTFEVGQYFYDVQNDPLHDGWYLARMKHPETGKESCGLVPGPFIVFLDSTKSSD
ncbi:Oidioi.mRNA.OKI2018_I69.chr1.g1481.t1.cds [Oikopleura dioica]|uniref:Oidioi.mRNA.OKI2018_I69.chr1.g1481.t1.cds n=1 Tax=Oikopleura dioica TaxID=34765 RepID=A0ABN7SRL5_OIKDI|nr:Oidioi.mRNA.OKI2018_I69.chr1.g1481.t1.cds [Oikopleura dioica]